MLAMMPPFAPTTMIDAMHDALAMSDALAYATPAACRLSCDRPRLSENADAYEVEIAAPGVAKADLTIEVVEGSKLTVRGRTDTEFNTHFVDYSIALPKDADADNATADNANGLITVRVPKKAAAEAAPARVAIGVASMADATPNADDQATPSPPPYKLRIVAAGVAAADLELVVEGGVLKVSGATERTGARLARRFNLPRDADPTNARAAHVDGILTVTVPKKPEPMPRRIALRAQNDKEPAAAAAGEEAMAE